MRLMDALANLDRRARVSDGARAWSAEELVNEVACGDRDEYEIDYLADGRLAVYRLTPQGLADARPAYFEL